MCATYCAVFLYGAGADKQRENRVEGLLTGGAFPQGGAIMFKHIPCRKKPKALQNAPGMRRTGICGVYPGERRGCASNRTAQRISIYASRFGLFARLASEHF
jgi:hypothetical protein